MKDTFRLENQTIYFGTERAISASPQTIWRYLTETDKLKQWFPELEIGELGVNGFWRFILPILKKQCLSLIMQRKNIWA